MKTYEGRRQGHSAIVTVDARPLNPRLDLWKHNPAGFEWGYCGSGPAQLALAILADHLGDNRQAINLHQRFKWNVVAELPRKQWVLTSQDVDIAIQKIRHWESVAGGVPLMPRSVRDGTACLAIDGRETGAAKNSIWTAWQSAAATPL